jgi:hypothetical protein
VTNNTAEKCVTPFDGEKQKTKRLKVYVVLYIFDLFSNKESLYAELVKPEMC